MLHNFCIFNDILILISSTLKPNTIEAAYIFHHPRFIMHRFVASL